MHRIAVIGSGIAGLAAASRLAAAPGGPAVTLLEAGGHFGGHANTVDLTLGGVSQGVDTGFLVFNHRTDRKSTRLNSSHGYISYAVFCLEKKQRQAHVQVTHSRVDESAG